MIFIISRITSYNVCYTKLLRMLEHIRISQWDMIDFIVNPDYKEMEWPREYWPKEGEQADKKMWTESLA